MREADTELCETPKDDGETAFPIQDLSKWQCPGLTVRDYFAAAALQGLMTSQNSDGEWRHDARQAASFAYAAADAMLKERAKR